MVPLDLLAQQENRAGVLLTSMVANLALTTAVLLLLMEVLLNGRADSTTQRDRRTVDRR